MRIDFLTWLEYLGIDNGQDWIYQKDGRENLNGDDYKSRGVRSKYVANMKSDIPIRKTKKNHK